CRSTCSKPPVGAPTSTFSFAASKPWWTTFAPSSKPAASSASELFTRSTIERVRAARHDLGDAARVGGAVRPAFVTMNNLPAVEVGLQLSRLQTLVGRLFARFGDVDGGE